MLKKALSEKDITFLSGLASAVITPPAPIRINAQDAYMDLDEIVQTAQAYWMMGYAWDEIDTALANKGYEQKEIDAAIKETKAYAARVLNKGPFSTIQAGQLVQLIDGTIAKVQKVVKDSCILEQGGETFHADVTKMNLKASATLGKAFGYRKSAKELLQLAQKELESPLSVTDIEPIDEPAELPETYQTVRREKAPSGWADIAPDIGEVEPVNKMLSKIINNLDGLHAMHTELKAQMAKIRKETLAPLAAQVKELTADEQTELKSLFLMVNGINEGLDSMDSTIFGEYEGKIVGFRQKIIENEVPPGVMDELTALKGIIEKNHPRVAKQVFSALDDYMKFGTTVERRAEKTFAKFPFREKPRKKSHHIDAQVLTKIKEFFKGLWDQVKKTTSDLVSKAFPPADEITQAITDFNALSAKAATTTRIGAALEVLKRG